MELEQWRSRIDAFHARFNAAAARRAAALADENASGTQLSSVVSDKDNKEGEGIFCGGCGSSVDRSHSQWCGACRCTAYCSRECQRVGWKARGHKAACKLLARARALPPADPSRCYVVQLKLVGREGLMEWAQLMERKEAGGGSGGGVAVSQGVAGLHQEMAAALEPKERVLFALEARQHLLLRYQIVPPSKRLEPHDLALFSLQAVMEPATDVPTLNMRRSEPQRPYAIWIPSDEPAVDDDGIFGGGGGVSVAKRPMSRPVGRLLAGAGLPTSSWYVGGGFCAEAALRPDVYGAGGTQRTGDRLINLFSTLDPDAYSEDEEYGSEDDDDQEDDDEEEEEGGGSRTGLRQRPPQRGGQQHQRLRVLMVAGMHLFGPNAGEGDDPMLTATAAALRRDSGAEVEVAMYRKKGGPRDEQALGQRLRTGGGGGGYDVCVVLGLGSGDHFKLRRPTHPWGSGPWRSALTEWVHDGGVLIMHGERAAAAVAREFFGLSWGMDGDFYRRTDHKVNRANPLLGDLANYLPTDYNVKACMLSNVPLQERIYATAPEARTHSLVPCMAGEPVEAGRTAMAAARVGGGAVAFFGDVNWEPPTMAAVAALSQRLVEVCRRHVG